MAETISRAEVKRHNKEEDAWIVINDCVYDVTKFAMLHPGGEKLLLQYAGEDATEDFYGLHKQSVLDKFGPRLLKGKLPATEAPVETNEADGVSAWGKISKVPYAEMPYWRGWKSPYYNESHVRFRKYVREFYDKEVREIAVNGETTHEAPSLELMQTISKAGLMHTQLGPGEHLNLLPMPAGLKPEEFDYFHSMILHEEGARVMAPGFFDGIYAGFTISVPALLHFGTEKMKKTVLPEILAGRQRSCLAITEAFAGSDVANLRTTATKSADGSHYIVNGTKKWITNGTFADYAVTAVRTGGAGAGGVSMLFIPLKSEGVNAKIIKAAYSHSAGTSYLTFENVKVPVENLMGKENQGFALVMANFNMERLHLVQGVVACMRYVTEECFKWATQRKVFGKPLMQQPVIRKKLGCMIADVESCSAWLELVTYQVQNMSFEEQNRQLGGTIGLLKYQATTAAQNVARDAVEIFGGRGLTQTGMGRVISCFHRTIIGPHIFGGAADVVLDLGVRQAVKAFAPDLDSPESKL
ncbi:Long-chain specific acyl-CoA dehydrogenase, mitochondrial [Hondaea fermentalgiana]|uniref:Long-chain specific acyl-CoA dehydrogenase, mitochondrial n=1 Tax=Hondaea fermentalgiana TaxID=2315210 RepID=A0A2R5GUC5_9STRA|nr:Long-chain specific acyl-CoA dehydrogenase, mitochondrial [Hondaea fermentalgiana]|eukprot:GBG33368.1 Long-chain specific acyl-CoA dehydrogenase, mitochondrial [Hondaea fermentalgiana]